MKIVIDGRMISWTGIGTYTKHLLSELQSLDHANEYVVLLQRRDYDSWNPTAANFKKKLANYQPFGASEQIGLAWLLYLIRPDLVHFLNFNAPVLYFGQRMFTIHDLTLVHYKNLRGKGLKILLYEIKYWAMRLVMRCSIQRSVAIITCTSYVKKEIISTYRRGIFQVSGKKIHPVHLGLDASPKGGVQTENPVGSPYLLYVGNAYPHKNLENLIVAFRLLLKAYPDMRLVIVGKKDYFMNKLETIASRQGFKDRILFPGYVPNENLDSYYKHASIYVFPSLSEGFGLPPLGAMSYGTPVVAARATCLPEVLGEAAIYFNPRNPADIADTIEGVLNSPDEIARMRTLGPKQAAKYSWRRMAKQTLQIYQGLLQKRQ
jgi:glycosyltransferase involved in cell wall biosynthesis